MTNSAFAITPGLRVLVTAGASGIGHTIASALLEAGARVHLCDVDRDALAAVRNDRPDFSITGCNVADENDVYHLFEDVKSTLGGLDVLVNNAGIAGQTGRIENLDSDEWRRCIEVNLNGQFFCLRRATPLIKASKEGSMICISSVAGRLGYAYRTPYAATKWAIVGMVQSLAKELGPDGVRINAILPGIVEGPRIRQVIRDRADAVGVSEAEMEEEYLSKISMRRMIDASDIAGMALFLCSAAARNVSGQALSVCGNVETL